MKQNLVWIVDDDHSIRWVLEKTLQQEGLDTVCFDSGDKVIANIQQGAQWPDVIVTDVRMPGIDGFELLKKISESVSLPVIVMTAHADLESAVSSYKEGAFDYLPKPFDIDDAVILIKKAINNQHEQKKKANALVSELINTNEIIGEAPAMQEVFRAIGRLAKSNVSILLTGASGTGKELVAKALHQYSTRSNSPFIALNMAAIPKDLIESELFGHEQGAFTSANKKRQGRFEQANEGTLFLDEIGDMPAEAQTRLLRVLAEGEFYRVGGNTPVRVDVRIIAATHQDLKQKVLEGTFREDLYYRLNVIQISLPNLNERREDIPKLADYFLQKSAKELNVEVKDLSQEVIDYIIQLNWSGNVRQLENTCRWLTVMASGRQIQVNDLPDELLQEAKITDAHQQATEKNWEQLLRRWAEQEIAQGHKELLNQAIPALEKTMIEVALEYTGGMRQEAASILGWGRNTLTRKIKELKISS